MVELWARLGHLVLLRHIMWDPAERQRREQRRQEQRRREQRRRLEKGARAVPAAISPADLTPAEWLRWAWLWCGPQRRAFSVLVKALLEFVLTGGFRGVTLGARSLERTPSSAAALRQRRLAAAVRDCALARAGARISPKRDGDGKACAGVRFRISGTLHSADWMASSQHSCPPGCELQAPPVARHA